MKNRLSPSGLLLFCLPVVAFLGMRFWRPETKETSSTSPLPHKTETAPSYESEAQSPSEVGARMVEKQGVMSKIDYLKMTQLAEKGSQGRLSEAEFDWLVALYHKKPLRPDAPSATLLHHLDAFYALGYACDTLTPKQREQVALLCLPLLSSSEDKDAKSVQRNPEKVAACNLLVKLHYHRATPQIETLLTHPAKEVRRAAQEAVEKLQSSPKEKPRRPNSPKREG